MTDTPGNASIAHVMSPGGLPTARKAPPQSANAMGPVVSCTVSGVGVKAAVTTARTQKRPDVALLDLEMPPGDGLQAAAGITARLGIPVVPVTRHARPAILRRAPTAEVSGFVPKTTPASRLAEIIRAVHAGRRYVDPEIAASALTENDCPLTARELEILAVVRSGIPIVDIARTVRLAPGTVRNYLSAAMAKLGVGTRHAAARHAWEQGWI